MGRLTYFLVVLRPRRVVGAKKQGEWGTSMRRQRWWIIGIGLIGVLGLPVAASASGSPAIAAWASQGGDKAVQGVVAGLDAVDAAEDESPRALSRACTGFEADVQVFQTLPPFPDPTGAFHLGEAEGWYLAAAQACIAGASESNSHAQDALSIVSLKDLKNGDQQFQIDLGKIVGTS